THTYTHTHTHTHRHTTHKMQSPSQVHTNVHTHQQTSFVTGYYTLVTHTDTKTNIQGCNTHTHSQRLQVYLQSCFDHWQQLLKNIIWTEEFGLIFLWCLYVLLQVKLIQMLFWN